MKDDKNIISAVNTAKNARREFNKDKYLQEVDLTLSFREMLGELTKKELQEIRRTWNFTGISQLNKAELIQTIAKRIEENSEEWLRRLNKEQFSNLKKVVRNNDKQRYQYRLSDDVDFELLRYYRKRGIVFSGRYNNKVVLFIPKDLLQIIKKVINKPEINKQINKNNETIEVTRGLLIYCGVLPSLELYQKIKDLINIELTCHELELLIVEYSLYNYGLECAGNYIYLSEVNDLDSIYVEQYTRSDLDYYSPGLKTVKKAARLGHEPWNLVQRRFKKHLTDEYNLSIEEAEYILDICVFMIKNDKGSMELLNILQNFIEFSDMEEVRETLNLLTELQNNTRQWGIKGHMPNELFQEEQKYLQPLPENDEKYARDQQGTIVRTKEKVGRNDPCPCGSGKKYKKCCGR